MLQSNFLEDQEGRSRILLRRIAEENVETERRLEESGTSFFARCGTLGFSTYFIAPLEVSGTLPNSLHCVELSGTVPNSLRL